MLFGGRDDSERQSFKIISNIDESSLVELASLVAARLGPSLSVECQLTENKHRTI